jgi:DNA repair exonuclease SbcCD nuclease subunit
MRIGITGDFHLGKSLGARTDDSGVNLRSRDLESAVRQVIDGFIRARVDHIAILGDLFDKAKPPEFARQFLTRELLRYDAANPRGRKFILRGNHDATASFAIAATAVGTTALALPDASFVVADAYEPRLVELGEDVAITMVPWMRNDADFLAAIMGIRPSPGRHNLLFLHAGLSDLAEFAERCPGSQTLTRATVPTGFDWIFSGHFHGRKTFEDLGWTFVGSPERLSSAEVGQEKGFLVYDTDTRHFDFHAIATRSWYDLGVIDAAKWDGAQLVAELEAMRTGIPDWDEAMVWAKIRHVRPDVYASYDVAAVRAIKASAFAEDIDIRPQDALFGDESDDARALEGDRPLLDDLPSEWDRHVEGLDARTPQERTRILERGLRELLAASNPADAAEPVAPAAPEAAPLEV